MTTVPVMTQASTEADEHSELREMLHDLQASLGKQAGSLDHFRGCLRRFIECILVHFDHEGEDGGFFSELVACAPRMEHRAMELMREHYDLRSELFSLEQCAARALDAPWARAELESRLSHFAHGFLTHEAAEMDLLQEVYCEDLGLGA